MNDDYLWDRTGPPDPLVARLEDTLQVFRHRSRRRWPARHRAVLAAAAAVALAAVFWGLSDDDDVAPPVVQPSSPYVASLLCGDADVDGVRLETACGRALPVGACLSARPGATVELRADSIGQVTVHDAERESRVLIEEVTQQKHLLHLERGRITAFVRPDVPARLFQVGTPAGLAVDLGCRYELTVDDTGRTRLEVTLGCVRFDVSEDRQAWVPAGFCMTAPPKGQLGPPVSVQGDAARFREAVDAWQEAEDTGGIKLDAVLAAASRRDAVTLYHMFVFLRPDDPAAERVLQRLAALELIPLDVSQDDLRRRSEPALTRLRRRLTGGWW